MSVFQKTKQATIIFILITATLDVMALGIVVPIFPRLIEDFLVDTTNAGLINGLFVATWALMQFLVSPILGSLSDRFGRRPVILISTVGLALDYVLMALAPNLWWLFVGRVLGGMTSASISTVYAYMTDITPVTQRAKAFGLIGAAFSTGFIIGPLLGGFMGEISSRAPFWLAAALSGIAFLFGLFILPESLPKEHRMAFSWKRANPIGAFKLLNTQARLLSLAAVNFLMNFCQYVFHAVFVLYCGYRFGLSIFEISLLLTLTAVLDVVVQAVLVGRVVKSIGNVGALITGLSAGGAGMALMGFAPTSLLFIIALFPTSLWGLAMPAIQALMTECVSESEQGQLQGANMSVIAVAGIGAPLVFGGVYTLFVGSWRHLNLVGAPFILSALIMGCAVFVGWYFLQKKSV